MDELTVKALGKINLGLDVLGRLDNGYHQVRMVMQTVHLYDTLKIYKTAEPGIRLRTNLGFLPVNEDNLCVKAARMLMEEFQLTEGICIDLHKRIPVAAGMAGGSSDGGAVLYAMNRMFDLGLSRRELMERGVKLGADVPYCLMRGTALAEGIGEELTPLPPMVKCPVLIAKPAISVSTPQVYHSYDALSDVSHPDIDGLIAAIREKDLSRIAARMGNVLEEVTAGEYPVIRELKEAMMESGALNAMMSGSGPTVFGLFDDEDTMERAKEDLRHRGIAHRVFGTTIYNNRR